MTTPLLPNRQFSSPFNQALAMPMPNMMHCMNANGVDCIICDYTQGMVHGTDAYRGTALVNTLPVSATPSRSPLLNRMNERFPPSGNSRPSQGACENCRERWQTKKYFTTASMVCYQRDFGRKFGPLKLQSVQFLTECHVHGCFSFTYLCQSI